MQIEKILYGLKQAPRAWYDKLKSALLNRGFVNTTTDFGLFVLIEEKVIVYMLIYVDDIFLTGLDTNYI